MVHNKVQVPEAENAVAECICRATSFAASVPDRWTGVFWEWPGATDILTSSWKNRAIIQELCESRGGRPGLSVLTSLLVSVDVKIY